MAQQLWEDDDPEAVPCVAAEFEALWRHPLARVLGDVVLGDVERILRRQVVPHDLWRRDGEPEAPFIEAPVARQGDGLAPHQRAFVARVARELDTFGDARFLLADDVGLGKTVQLAMAAMLIALTRAGPVLILAPKNLPQQWQDELTRLLAVPPARWSAGRWITEDGAEWPRPATSCPRRIGLFPTSLVTAETADAASLLKPRYACVVLDEAHRARRARSLGRDGEPNNLLRFMLELAPRAATVLLGTATPIQTDRMELYDLMRILHRGCERVLGGIGSPWTDPARAMDIVAGQAPIPNTPATVFAWLRDPLPGRDEHQDVARIRTELGLDDAVASVPPESLSHLSRGLSRAMVGDAEDLRRRHNPILRHVVKRRREDLRAPDGSPWFKAIEVDLRGEDVEDALTMPDRMAEAYDRARDYWGLIAKQRPGAGILKTLLLRRIGSSLRAGLLTAQRLLDPALALAAEEDEELGLDGAGTPDPPEAALLRSAVTLLQAAGNADPRLERILRYLRREGWADRGCILFSQYYYTADWIAAQLAASFPDRTVGVYGGQGRTSLWRDGGRQGIERAELQAMVRRRSLKLLVATDAASEGLNLQALATLINIDLPWNPARLEQRKGRIDRIGQPADTIGILNLRYRGSSSARFRWLRTLASRLSLTPCAAPLQPCILARSQRGSAGTSAGSRRSRSWHGRGRHRRARLRAYRWVRPPAAGR